MKKKIILLVFVFFVNIVMLAGCSVYYAAFFDTGRDIEYMADDGRIHIVCTSFPQYDWVRNIIKGNEENIALTFLAGNGADMHNFQPSALDIAKVSGCDMFIYTGGESEAWVDDAMEEAINNDIRVINMMDAVKSELYEEEHIESPDLRSKKHGNTELHEEEHEHGYDEHVWLSLKNAKLIAACIAEELADLDRGSAELYMENYGKFSGELDKLDEEFREVVRNGETDTLLFADRFPFRYFVEDYGLKYYAAFEGCSAETEAGFGTVAFLSEKLDELGLGAVIVIDGSDDRLARVIIENTSSGAQQILVMNSLQSVGRKKVESGMTYISAMKENLEVLKVALKMQK